MSECGVGGGPPGRAAGTFIQAEMSARSGQLSLSSAAGPRNEMFRRMGSPRFETSAAPTPPLCSPVSCCSPVARYCFIPRLTVPKILTCLGIQGTGSFIASNFLRLPEGCSGLQGKIPVCCQATEMQRPELDA